MFIRGIIKQMRALLLIMSSILRLRWVLFYNNPPVGLILWKQFLIKGSKAGSTLLYFYLLIQDAGIYLSSALCCHFFDWVFESGNRKKPYTAAGSAFGSKVPFFFFHTHMGSTTQLDTLIYSTSLFQGHRESDGQSQHS